MTKAWIKKIVDTEKTEHQQQLQEIERKAQEIKEIEAHIPAFWATLQGVVIEALTEYNQEARQVNQVRWSQSELGLTIEKPQYPVARFRISLDPRTRLINTASEITVDQRTQTSPQSFNLLLGTNELYAVVGGRHLTMDVLVETILTPFLANLKS